MKKVFLILLVVCLLSGGLLILVSIPILVQEAEIPFSLDDGLEGVMTITSPRYLRLGDPAELKLKISFEENEGKQTDSSVKIKADLQTLLLEVSPAEEFTAVIPEDGTAFFPWQMTPHNEEKTKVTLWCFRISSSGPELMLSRDIEFSTKTILGMRYRFARWLLAELIIICLALAGVTWYRNRHN
jgi:hypothetical protein